MERRTRVRAGVLSGIAASATFALIASGGCSNTLNGGLNLITGPDDAFKMDPKPTKLTLSLNGVDATVRSTVHLPADAGIALPAQSSESVDTIFVTAYDDAGDAVASGSTIPLALDQLSGITLNLFVQRNGQFSRLPSGDGGTAELDTVPSSSPLLTTVYDRYILIADGTGKTAETQLYDTLTWQVLPKPPELGVKPLSLAYVAAYTGTDAATDAETAVSALLAIDSKDAGNWVNLTASTSTDASVTVEAAAPDGGTFGGVAGGQTFYDSEHGNTYIVGATRTTGTPTTEILVISANGIFTWWNLNVPRLGATAVYAPGGGLYVFGGNTSSDDDGGMNPGTEVVDVGSGLSTGKGDPPDETTGAGAVAFDGKHILLAGGVTPNGKPAPVRMYVGEGGDAGTVPTLPVTFTTAQVFALKGPTATASFSALVVGTEPSGNTSVYRLTDSTATPVPFRVARKNAQAVILPNSSLGVVGGDKTLESFIP